MTTTARYAASLLCAKSSSVLPKCGLHYLFVNNTVPVMAHNHFCFCASWWTESETRWWICSYGNSQQCWLSSFVASCPRNVFVTKAIFLVETHATGSRSIWTIPALVTKGTEWGETFNRRLILNVEAASRSQLLTKSILKTSKPYISIHPNCPKRLKMDCYDHSQFHVWISGVALHDVVLVFGAHAQFIFSLKQTAWNWVFRAIWATLFEMLAMLYISMQIYNCIYLTENKETSFKRWWFWLFSVLWATVCEHSCSW